MKLIFIDWRFYIKTIAGLSAFILMLVLFGSPAEANINAAAWLAHAERMEQKYELQTGMLRAICEQETHWRNVVGAHGEIGVCQVQAATVRMICPACDGNAARQVFTVGARGPQVLRLQGFLKSEGYYLGHLDGIFGPGTRTAVTLYQQRQNLVADGIVGKITWRTMFAEPYPGTPIEDALWNPELNIEWAARYLVWLRENVSEDPIIMIGAYNGGPGNQIVRYMRSVVGRLDAI